MQINLFTPVELKDIRHDINHWKGIADSMAANYPKHEYAVVEDMFGNYVCMPITAKFERGCLSSRGVKNSPLERELKVKKGVRFDNTIIPNCQSRRYWQCIVGYQTRRESYGY